ncbi:hypothetical protein [Labrys wisconsinensis]|uniref:Uncharacterized protein n=1 Tax=Labrys wisconsinensis TaxID=425677 RepID=A0ABU0JFJ0_9HYPH|nr:hypothetical protein [Labrys wisconsinensis]MDQ0473051.1 hypothetical protein [Labrys wisconsinensis]
MLKANFALAIKVKQDIPHYLVEHRKWPRPCIATTARTVMRQLLLGNAHHPSAMCAAGDRNQARRDTVDCRAGAPDEGVRRRPRAIAPASPYGVVSAYPKG